MLSAPAGSGSGCRRQSLPEESPLANNVPIGTVSYALPVWTTAAALLRGCKSLGPGLTVGGLQSMLNLCTVPVTITRPDGDQANRFLDVTHFACFGSELLVRAGR